MLSESLATQGFLILFTILFFYFKYYVYLYIIILTKTYISMENSRTIGSTIYMIFAVCTGVIGHNIHGSMFWAIMDWLFAPLVWLK